MGRSIIRWRAGWVVIALGILTLPACSSGSKGYEKGMKAGDELHELAKKIETGEKQLNVSLEQADKLVNATGPDPRKQFEQYRKSLKSLESTAEDVRDLANDMQKKSEAYFAQWEKDAAKINDENIKDVTVERRTQRMEHFRRIQTNYQAARDAFRPFLADLKDIEQALSVELTPGSLESMKPFVTKARNDAVPLNKALDDLRSQFRELGVEMGAPAKQS